MWLHLLSACANSPPPSVEIVADAPGTYAGRTIATTMHSSGQNWLIRPGREQEEGATELHRALKVRKGQTVCDVGAGNGYHSLPLARAVGKRGRVIATDIQPAMLEGLRKRAAGVGLTNIETVLGNPTDAGLPKDTCDLVLLVDVYHEFSDPQSMLAGIRDSLTPNGRVALVEYRAEDPRVPMKPLHKMAVAQCDLEYRRNGFQRSGRYDELPWQHLLFYTRAD